MTSESTWTNPEYTTEVTVADGKVAATFYVEIETGENDTWHDMRLGNVQRDWPVLRVTTHTGYDDAGEIIIRKRAYTVDLVFVADRRGGEIIWRTSHRDHYDRGLRDASGNRVSAGGTVHTLTRLAEQARDRFIAEHPDWELRSHKRTMQARIDRELDEIARLRERIAAHEATVESMRLTLKQIDDPASVPGRQARNLPPMRRPIVIPA